MLSTTEKMRYLWNHSHSDAEIVIELQDLDDLLNMKLDNYMIRDIKKYWNIIQCEHNNNRYKRKYKWNISSVRSTGGNIHILP